MRVPALVHAPLVHFGAIQEYAADSPPFPPRLTRAATACSRAGEEGAGHPWGYLAGALGEVARHDPRPAVADAAAAALLEVVAAHAGRWDQAAWQVGSLLKMCMSWAPRLDLLPVWY